MEEVEKKAEVETKETEAKITLTDEVAERIEESVRKVAEKLVEKEKAFRFHGTETKKKEVDAVRKNADMLTFVKAIATGDHATAMKFTEERAKSLGWGDRETKAITVGGAAGSQYLVPVAFETEVLATFDTYDEIIREADIKTFNQPGNIFELNELDTRVVAWYVDEDSTGLTASQPSFSEPQVAIADLIGATDISLDFLEDTEVDIMGTLAKQYGEEMAKKLQARLINGDVTVSGVVTKGILNTAGTNEVLIAATASGFSGITANDIENAYFDAIAVDYFQSANKDGKWFMSPVTLYNLRANIRSSSSDRDYLSIFDPVAMTLMGRPVVLTNQMPTPTTTVSDPFIAYGNLKNHLKIYRKRGLTMKLNDSGTSRGGRNLNYQLGRELVVSQRIGHQVVLAEGLTVIKT